ncbi:MAG: XRE family transcriptional regulator [Mesorhizobium sp.]|uniref:XRE family transcriptional regulator n=1 Tax=Mesorhizobium sp. TaxID=1871066 RepID=UPI000FE7B61E|nr:XRE family transcriptional regulator [Mesorhizobium sp.]RWM02545.1 MAG: XRE family transcriptional regulator [Mesorhizobium sp.]TIO48446.1 MAG: XRE family transcriptional regulator [Mesorhizobium sp.]TIO56802.1 MAG: XRE family transcriptional regulator [Mesorhizobium sp.]TJV58449.1 MAG: XRE family transcriptional regulator [Mesorhizobium sp.]
MPITPQQCQTGRALAKIDREELAAEVGGLPDVIEAYETGLAILDGELAKLVQHSLENLGVEFLPEEDGFGVGVRLKVDRAGTRQIGSWEAEGGRVAEDDVP